MTSANPSTGANRTAKSLRCALIGLDPSQQEWLAALRTLHAEGTIQLIAVGHRALATARELGNALEIAHYDDLRQLTVQCNPQCIILDRPAAMPIDFPLTCLQQKIAIFSIGLPVATLAEAQAMMELLPPRTHLLYVMQRLAPVSALAHGPWAEQFLLPIHFVAGQWFAQNSAAARDVPPIRGSVKSLSVLAWDVFSTLINLLGLPESVFATLRGVVPLGGQFADITGAVALTLRFAEQAVASLAISDRVPPGLPPHTARCSLLLAGQNGQLQINEDGFCFRDAAGKMVEELKGQASEDQELPALREFFAQQNAVPNMSRGWKHHLEATAATMEAMLVSHRTGAAEFPERLLALRR